MQGLPLLDGLPIEAAPDVWEERDEQRWYVEVEHDVDKISSGARQSGVIFIRPAVK